MKQKLQLLNSVLANNFLFFYILFSDRGRVSKKIKLQIMVQEYGTHCSFQECNRLDFLPIKCTACSKQFCSSHYSYSNHNCQSASIQQLTNSSNFVLPTCPLCNKQVPFTNQFRSPDEAISNHIDQGCAAPGGKKSPNKKKKEKSPGQCTKKGCKKKELVPITCKECNQVFCLTHRYKDSHDCIGKEAALRKARMEKYGNGSSSIKKATTSSKPVTTGSRTAQEQRDHEMALRLQRTYETEADRRRQRSMQEHAREENCAVM